LQECDCKYEKNDFEKSLLLISEKTRQCRDAQINIPHNSKLQMKKQNDARKKGPKVSALDERCDMVRLAIG
jgi:hypothetical protein